MMKNMKEEELEFISVSGDDDNNMNSAYVDHSQPERANDTIGYWLLNQSKVRNYSQFLQFTHTYIPL